MSKKNKEYKIFMVEDNDEDRDLILKFLNTKGYTVYWATNFQDALKNITKLKDIDCFVLDQQLHNDKGIHLYEELQKKTKVRVSNKKNIEREIPAIVFTHVATNDTKEEAYEKGISVVVGKDSQSGITEEKLEELNYVIQNLKNQKELDDLRLKSLYAEEQSMKAVFTNTFFSDYLLKTQDLISKGKKDEAIEQLGRFRNFSLDMMKYIDNDIISLEDELEFIEGYNRLVQLHISNKILFKISKKTNVTFKSIKLPPLILFPLIHNYFIAHGILHIKQEISNKIEYQVEVYKKNKKEISLSLFSESIIIDNNKLSLDNFNNLKNNFAFLKRRINLFNKSKNSSLIKNIKLVNKNEKDFPYIQIKYF